VEEFLSLLEIRRAEETVSFTEKPLTPDAEPIAYSVAEYRAYRDEPDQDPEMKVSLRGKETEEHDDDRSGKHQPDERQRLGERYPEREKIAEHADATEGREQGKQEFHTVA